MKRQLFNTFLSGTNHRFNAVKVFFFAVLLSGMGSSAFANITVTPAVGGTNICSSKAADGSAPAYTTLGVITLAEGAVADLGNSGGNWTCTMNINAPAGWQFNTASVMTFSNTTTGGADVTGTTVITFSSTVLEVRFAGTNRVNLDTVFISGLQVQAINTSSAPGYLSVNFPTGGIATGVVTGTTGTDFGDLSQTPTAITGATSICLPGNVVLSDATGSGVWSSSNTNLATVSGGTVTGVADGVVNIDYTVAGCTTMRSVTVTSAAPAITGPTTVCQNSTITLSNTSPGGIWSSGTPANATVVAGTGVVTGVITTGGTAVITYSITSCGAPQTYTVTVNPRPAAITGSANSMCVGSTISVSDVIAGGTWSSTTSSVATVLPAGTTVFGVAVGTSVISYTLSSDGCARTATVTVLTAPSTFGGPSQVCIGSTITLSNATAGGTWSAAGGGGAPLFVTSMTNGTVIGNNAGVGIVTYSVGSCGTATVAITVNALPNNITGTTTLCVGSTTTLSDVTPGGTWSSGTTTVATILPAGTTVTGVGPGTSVITYVVTATGCARTTNVTVNTPPASITGTPTVCQGATTNLSNTVTGGAWSSSTPGNATVNGTGRVGGVLAGTTVITYSVTTCPTATITVTVNATPSAITGNTNTCIGGSTNLSDALAGGTWSSVSTGIATVLPAGTAVTGVAAGTSVISYQITATGCATTTTVTVHTPPNASITGNTSVCAGRTTQLSNSVGGGAWFSGTTGVATVTGGGGLVTSIIPGTTIISYSITACPSATVTVTVDALPSITGGPATICTGGPTNTITLSDNLAGGLWSSSANAVATVGSANGTVTAVTQGNTQITYSITATGCASTTTITVNAPPAGITGNASVCTGATTALSNTVTGGVWSSSNTNDATVTNVGLVTGVAVGTPIISYAITSCPTATLSVSVNQTPVAIAGAATSVCQNSTITLSDGTASGVWSSSNTFRATVSAGNVTGAVGTGAVNISYTLGSCSAVRTLTVNATPVAIVGNNAVCTGATTRLSDAPGGGAWSSATSSVATVAAGTGVVSGTTAGTSVITYKLNTGCLMTKTITVNQSPDPVTGPVNVCVGQGITLSDDITGGTWTSGNTSLATIDPNSGAVSGITNGSVPITYTDGGNACTATTTITVVLVPSTITGNTSVCVGAVTTLSNASPGGNWSIDNTSIATVNPLTGDVTGASAGVANVTYDFGASCAATTSITVNPLAIAGTISGPGSVCLGTTVTLTTTGVGGVWSTDNTAIATVDVSGNVTGVAVGNFNAIYSASNGCGTVLTSIPMTVDQFTPSVTISANPGFSSCVDSVVTFTANPVFGGSAPAYQWLVNGHVSSVLSSFSYTPLTGDVVICIMTSNASCVSTSVATDTATMTVNPNLPAGVSITTGVVGDTVCLGTLTAFTATPTNGGGSPSYQWYVNNVLQGTTNPFSYTPDSADVVAVVITSSYQCASPATVTSNSVTMTVDVTQVPAVTIVASANPSCLGNPVTFTAEPLYGGLAPFFRWTQNGINVATGPTYTTVPDNGDQFYCTMMSSSACKTLDSVYSNFIIEVVDSPIVPVVTVHAHTVVIGVGQSDSLIAVVTPAIITAPTYQWYLNGVAIPGATLRYYIATPGATGSDYYYCIAGNGNACNTTSLSNLITLYVDPLSASQIPTGNYDVKLVPNPNTGTFTVEGTISANDQEVTIQISDMVGQVVYTGTASVQNEKLSKQIALGNQLANGVYMLHIITNNAHKVIRFSLSR